MARFEDFTPDFSWTIPGSNPLSGRTVGVDALQRRGFAFRSRLSRYGSSAYVIQGTDDLVVRMGQSQGQTLDGRAFSGPQVLVFRFAGTRIAEVTEFLDMDLIERVVYGDHDGANALEENGRGKSA
jgi:ketosteroid isomerase-like protein